MLDLTLFDNRVFAFSVLASILYFTSLNAIIITLPIELQVVQQMNGFDAGLALMPLAATIALISPFAGSLSDRVSARYLSSGGAAIVGVGALLLGGIGLHPSTANIALHMILIGIGIGFFNQPNNSTIMGNAPRDRLGTAGAILATSRATGGLIGAALAGAIYFFRVAQLGPGSVHGTAPATAVYVTVGCLSFLAVAVSAARGRTGKAAPAT
jgi:MFS family permease